MAKDSAYTLFASRGCGSVLVEAQLTLAGAPWSTVELPFEALGPDRQGELQTINPLGQVPTLVLPDGAVMTESAAITLHIAERFPEAELAPAVTDKARSQFLRWLVFFGSPLYATFTYGDVPARWVGEGEAAHMLRERTNGLRQSLWRYLEGQVAPSPWLLGDSFSALDVFVAAMTRWRPRREWFVRECPKLHSVAEQVEKIEQLKPVWARNFS